MCDMGWLTNIKKLLDTETGAPSDTTATLRPPLAQQPPPPPWRDDDEPDDVRMASYPSPDVGLERLARTAPNTIPLGIEDGRFQVSDPDHHVLAIAPPRSDPGKTASLIIPSIVSHQGPVVVATTKSDVLAATAMARAQHGELWCYCPDGDTSDIPPGARELRWSPISGAADFDVAIRTSTAMVATLRTGTVTADEHWLRRAAEVLAPVFHWAALTGRTMHDVRNLVYSGVGENLDNVWRELRERHSEDAAALLQSILTIAPDERNSIASTAAGVLKGYQLSGALRTTEDENFDADNFVTGGPFGMRADTLYITSSPHDQLTVAPLVVGLLDQIRQAAYRRSRVLIQKGDITTADGQVFPFKVGGVGAVPTLFALDELYGLAPLPNLRNILAEGASQGILIAAAVQELSMLEGRWPEASAFLTLFGHVLVFPGIRDRGTLEAVSTLLGHDRRNFDPDAVSRGPGGPDDVFHFRVDGWRADLRMLPYWRSLPWPPILTAYLERAVSGRVPAWRYWEAERWGERPAVPDVLPGLPSPDLRTWAEAPVTPSTHPIVRDWGARYLRAARPARGPAEPARRASRDVRDGPRQLGGVVGHPSRRRASTQASRAGRHASPHRGGRRAPCRCPAAGAHPPLRGNVGTRRRRDDAGDHSGRSPSSPLRGDPPSVRGGPCRGDCTAAGTRRCRVGRPVRPHPLHRRDRDHQRSRAQGTDPPGTQ